MCVMLDRFRREQNVFKYLINMQIEHMWGSKNLFLVSVKGFLATKTAELITYSGRRCSKTGHIFGALCGCWVERAESHGVSLNPPVE